MCRPLSAFIACLFVAGIAHARITVTATAGGTATVDPLGGDAYDVTLTATSTSEPTIFTISRSTAGGINH